MCSQKACSNSPLLVFLWIDELAAKRNVPCALVRSEWAEAAAGLEKNKKKEPEHREGKMGRERDVWRGDRKPMGGWRPNKIHVPAGLGHDWPALVDNDSGGIVIDSPFKLQYCS